MFTGFLWYHEGMDNHSGTPATDNEFEQLRAQNNELKNRNTELETLVKFYEEQIRLAKQRQFGASSEKTDDVEQLGLFDEAENTADPKAEEKVTIEAITYTRKKRVGKRADDLSNLPVETIEYELPESEQICPSEFSPQLQRRKRRRNQAKKHRMIPNRAALVRRVL